MDKTRRNLVLGASVVPWLGLAGCQSDADSQADVALLTDERAGAAASSAIGGLGLKVTGVGLLAPDAVFRASTVYQYLVPDSTVNQAFVTGNSLYISVIEQVSNHHRSLQLKLTNPTVGQSINVSTLPSGTATVLVNVAQFNSTTGQGSSAHYDYLLAQGQITVMQLTEALVELSFSAVQANPTSKTLVSNNVASRSMRLTGVIRLPIVREEISWMA